jgi:hypothetical protein
MSNNLDVLTKREKELTDLFEDLVTAKEKGYEIICVLHLVDTSFLKGEVLDFYPYDEFQERMATFCSWSIFFRFCKKYDKSISIEDIHRIQFFINPIPTIGRHFDIYVAEEFYHLNNYCSNPNKSVYKSGELLELLEKERGKYADTK